MSSKHGRMKYGIVEVKSLPGDMGAVESIEIDERVCVGDHMDYSNEV